jgi:osmotically-inducible protein OsmY
MTHSARSSQDKHAERVESERQEAALTAMLEDMYGGRATQTTGSPRTDAALAEAVPQAQDAEPGIEAGQIRSSVEHGWATLDGEVRSSAEQQQAGRAALEVPGIQGVQNRVRRSGR